MGGGEGTVCAYGFILGCVVKQLNGLIALKGANKNDIMVPGPTPAVVSHVKTTCHSEPAGVKCVEHCSTLYVA